MRDADAVAATARWIIINNNNCPESYISLKTPKKWNDWTADLHGGFCLISFLKKQATLITPRLLLLLLFSLVACVLYEHVRGSFRFNVVGGTEGGWLFGSLSIGNNSPSTLFCCGLFWQKQSVSRLSLSFSVSFFRSVLSLPSPWLRSLVFTLRSAGACGGAYFWKREMSVEKRERQIYSFDLSVVLRCVRQTPRQPRLPATWAQSSNKLNKCGHDPLVPWLRWFHKFIFVSFKFKFSSFFNYIFFCSFGFWLDWFSWT